MTAVVYRMDSGWTAGEARWHLAFGETFNFSYASNFPKAFSLMRRMGLPPEMAEEAVHDAFAKAYASVDGFRGNARFSSWFYRICANTAKDIIRKRSKTGRGEDRRALYPGYPGSDRYTPDYDFCIIREALRLELADALGFLTPGQRRALLMRANDYTFREIAEAEGTSVPTAKGRVYLGKKKMRNRLQSMPLVASLEGELRA